MKKKFPEKLWLPLIVLLGLALRLIGFFARDFWYDESFTGIAIRENWNRLFEILVADIHPPLYYIVAKVLAAPFDYSVTGIRLVSLLFGLLGIVMTYVVAKELFENKRIACLSAFFASISPFLIYYSQEARMYAMLGTLILIASYFFIRAQKTREWQYLLLWGAFASLAALTHYMGLLFSVAFAGMYVVWQGFELATQWRELRFKKLWHLLAPHKWIIGILLGVLLFLPWYQHFMEQYNDREERIDWIQRATFDDVPQTLEMFLIGIPPGELSAGTPAPNHMWEFKAETIFITSIILLTLILAFCLKRDLKRTLLLLVPSVGFVWLIYLLSFWEKDYFISRYMLPAAYFLCILLGFWIASVRRTWLRWLFVGAYLVALLAIPQPNYSRGYTILAGRQNEYTDAHFYVLNTFDYVAAKYYFGYDQVTLYNISWVIYNPFDWLGVNGTIQRTETYQDILSDPNAYIIAFDPIENYHRDEPAFEPDMVQEVARLANMRLYRFRQY